MSGYECALGIHVEFGEPCPHCGAPEDSEEGCLGLQWKWDREERAEAALAATAQKYGQVKR